MNTQKLSNITLATFRLFLARVGCREDRTQHGRGGHERWTKEGLARPIILQTHVDPVPEYIVKNTLRNLGLAKSDYFRIMCQKA